LVSWRADSGAGGTWIGNVFTPEKAGTWLVTANMNNLIGSISLMVNHGSIYSISISPKDQEIDANSKQTYITTAYDSNGNSWDVTELTIWSIKSNAGGYWSSNVYTPANAGNWQVTATIAGLTDNAHISIDHGASVSMSISPKTAFITAGNNQGYSASASDINNNVWDITSTSTWLINSNAGGYWTQNIYTSQNYGSWVVTGQSDSKTDSSQLTVYYQIDFNHDANVDYLDTIYFCDAYTQFNQNHIFTSTCDLNHNGAIDFMDLVNFADRYIAFYQNK
jgi:hypothetical protein